MSETESHYTVLGIHAGADFAELRTAYRRRAMECHPDRFDGDTRKEAEFKRVVEAFNILSDPVQRRNYDIELGLALEEGGDAGAEYVEVAEDEGAILDTLADDILEELIVGNTIPRNTSLQTLLLDLEKTERFCLFREAKTRLYEGRGELAGDLFRRYLRMAPANILARYFLGQSCIATGRWREAEHELANAIRIGRMREPPLQLRRIRAELDDLRRRRPGFLGAVRRFFVPPPKPRETMTSEEKERHALNRTLNRLAAERLRSERFRGQRDAKRLRGFE